MAFPPFPSQDLAKLVLGYLAEEQLMTVYDEFLQASPYLDALRNEYDRIFMTSLKSILAEYRAVKIYVDTCKPYVLRKRIFQCTNLLDVVKFLISNADINKIQLEEATEKASIQKQKEVPTPKPNTCEECNYSKLTNCVCKSRQSNVQQVESISGSHMETSSLQNSVETTPLADLPGNHVTTRKKQTKEKDSIVLNSNSSSGQNCDASVKQSFSSIISPEEYLANCQSPVKTDSTLSVKSTNLSKPHFEEFDSVLKSVVDRNKTLSVSECQANRRVSNATTFKDFASGVASGECPSATYSVPDSSTSENLNVIRVPSTKDHYKDNIKGPPQSQLMLQVSQINDSIKIRTCRTGIQKCMKLPKSTILPNIHPKPADTKIKIISDVKVGTNYSDTDSDTLKDKLLVQSNATSTPLMQMQTIMINGTPAYKHTLASKFTKDEIMAMPTLIVVPASGSSQIPTSIHCEPIMTHNCDAVSKTSSSTQILEPLVIDVQSNIPIPNKPTITALPDLSQPKSMGTDGLVKTVDLKNASVPKDNVISMESNTPQVLPPTRKSSSTPRRTSHIRVLDFATPRRILHETINEQVPNQNSDPPLEIVLSGSPNVLSTQTAEAVTEGEVATVINNEGNSNIDSGSAKENNSSNKIKQLRKYDWDADLRALVANDQIESGTSSHRSQKTKAKSSRKRKSRNKTDESNKSADGNDKTESKKKTRTRKKSPKIKKTNIKNIEEDDEPTINLNSDVPVKPNVNIIASNYHDKVVSQHSHKTGQNGSESINNKPSDKDDELIETPEAERLSLQNVIGAKLNISDLLETPYKQALYDIQMETPRFLGSGLPDGPVSDIKIMNIPTPRFLNTPKAIQATPSSYSSRPTDYSSGGSYYKPDDQDYMPIPDLITCPVSSSKEDIIIERSPEKDSDVRKSRPVRKCTKNVSYYRNSGVANKTKDVEDNADSASSCSEPISVNSSLELKHQKETLPKTPRDKSQSINKIESKKRNSTIRKKISPKESIVKDRTKSFMKIKPRYTPKKETPSARNRKKSIQSPHSKRSSLQYGKKTSKGKLVNTSPVIVALPTKSRRKSSTPRKLHCTKNFNSESSGHNSPEITVDVKHNLNRAKSSSTVNDSDNEQLALRWSDDGSQEHKTRDVINAPATEIENITKIQEFIESSDMKKCPNNDLIENPEKRVQDETDGTFQRDLIKRGFDLATAKSIERDLLDDPSCTTPNRRNIPITVEIVEAKKDDRSSEKVGETDSSITNELHIVQDDTDEDEIEFYVHECNDESKNYIVFEYDDTKEVCQQPPIKLKDNYTMEICIDDVTMRLRASPFCLVLDQDPLTVDEIDYSYKETEQAVESISNMHRLYTPLKDTIKAQCYEIFDSTLTSLDTPLKSKSPVKSACVATVSELVYEVEKETKDKTEPKKRKRQSVSDEPANSSKRTKPDAELLLKTANIQNIDIETVLTKLHGH